MHGTLTIEGSLDELAEIAKRITAQYPEGIAASVEPLEVDGWTVERARALLARLAPRQHTTIELVVDNGGYVSSDRLRRALADSREQLRGLTGPISKHVNRLSANGVLPAGTAPPTTTDYDTENPSFQRARGIQMNERLVPVFRAALNR